MYSGALINNFLGPQSYLFKFAIASREDSVYRMVKRGIDTVTQGRFITVEGGEGVGKTTQCTYLLEILREYQVEAILTREPGGSEGADQIRQLLVTGPEDRWDALAETLLLFAARRDHLVRTIMPALEGGIWVICDRFGDSTLAYQGFGHGIDLKFLKDMSRKVTGDLNPDITFILDAPTKIGIARALKRGGMENRFESLLTEFHEKARLGFKQIAVDEPHRCHVVNATKSINSVKAEIATILIRQFELEPRRRHGQSTLRQRSRAS
jgi:dTMP kinase